MKRFSEEDLNKVKESIENESAHKSKKNTLLIKIILYLVAIFVVFPLLIYGIYTLMMGDRLSLVGGILITFFATAGFLVLLVFAPLVFKRKKKVNKYRDSFMMDALKEIFGKDVAISLKGSLNKGFLKDNYISPLDLERIDEQIVTTLNGQKISLVDVKTVNPAKERAVMTAGAILSGKVLAVGAVAADAVGSLVNKETINYMFDGVIIVASRKSKHVKDAIELRSNDLNMSSSFVHSKNEHLVKMESINFNEKFLTYSKDPKGTFYVLTPHVMETILKLESKLNRRIMLLFNEDYLVLAINDYHLNIGKDYINDMKSNIEMRSSIISNLYVIKDILPLIEILIN